MKWVQKRFDCECGWLSHELVPFDEINTMIELDCPICHKQTKRHDMNFKSSSKPIMDCVHAEGGVRIFENGKRKTLGTMRAVKEYADRNNCTFGSDDTEQEAQHQAAVKDKEYVTKITERVMTDWEQLQRQKKTIKR